MTKKIYDPGITYMLEQLDSEYWSMRYSAAYQLGTHYMQATEEQRVRIIIQLIKRYETDPSKKVREIVLIQLEKIYNAAPKELKEEIEKTIITAAEQERSGNRITAIQIYERLFPKNREKIYELYLNGLNSDSIELKKYIMQRVKEKVKPTERNHAIFERIRRLTEDTNEFYDIRREGQIILRAIPEDLFSKPEQKQNRKKKSKTRKRSRC